VHYPIRSQYTWTDVKHNESLRSMTSFAEYTYNITKTPYILVLHQTRNVRGWNLTLEKSTRFFKMAAYYYAAYFNTPLNQSTRSLNTSQHPFGIPSNTSNLPMSPAKPRLQESVMNTRSRAPTDGQEESVFFQLPTEIRLQVYEELLCRNAVNTKYLAKHGYRHDDSAGPLYPAILSTCRKAHDEAIYLLYTTHVFCAHPSLLTSLPHLITSAQPVLYPTVLCKIKRWHLTIRLDTDPRFTTAQATAAFSGAESLDIRVWQSMFDGADSSVLKLFMGVRGVKVARVGGSANRDLARWLEERMMMGKDEGENTCSCGNESGIVTCLDCANKVDRDGAGKWFGNRNAWQFGN
jgi:hypothetical protein